MFHVWMGVGAVLGLLGLIGSVAPVLPGTLLSLAGMLAVEFGTGSVVDFSLTTWIIVGLLVIASVVSDYVFPLLGAKKWWDTQSWTAGSIVGMVGGFLAPPWWLILGPIIGAFVGEYLTKRDLKQARKASRGSFLWSTASTVIKLIAAGFVLWYIIAAWI